jgi:hypothetical protein
VLRSDRLKDPVHAFLVFVHRATHPHIVVLALNTVLGRKRGQRSELLKTLHLVRELVLNENSTFRCTEISAPLSQCLLVKQLMDNPDSWAAFNRNTDHAGDVVQVTLGEALGTIQWVDPDHHIVFVKFIRKFQLVTLLLWSRNPVYLLHVLEVAAVSILLLADIVVEEKFSADVIHVELVGLNVWSLLLDLAGHFVFFANDRSSGVELLQVVDDRVLNVHISLRENIRTTRACKRL